MLMMLIISLVIKYMSVRRNPGYTKFVNNWRQHNTYLLASKEVVYIEYYNYRGD